MVKGKVRNSINYSIKDGICWSVMVGFVEPYIVPVMSIDVCKFD